MQFTTTKKNLESALHAAQQAVNPRNPLPILTGVLLTVKDDNLTITGTDLENTISRTVTVEEIVDEGQVVIPAKQFYELVKRLPDISVTIETTEDGVKITYGKQKAQIKTFKVEEYPVISKPDDPVTIELDTEELLNAIRKVYFAAADDITQGILSGVLFRFSPFGMELAATDRHRLNWHTIAAEADDAKDVVIPKQTLEKIIRLFQAFQDGKTTITVGENLVQFASNGLSIYSRIMSGQYPAFEKFVPKEFHAECTFNTKEILGALDRASLMTSKNHAPIARLIIKDGLFNIKAENETGYVDESFNVEHEGAVDMYFQTKYLQESLSVAGKKATMKFCNNKIAKIEEEDFYSVIIGVVISQNVTEESQEQKTA